MLERKDRPVHPKTAKVPEIRETLNIFLYNSGSRKRAIREQAQSKKREGWPKRSLTRAF